MMREQRYTANPVEPSSFVPELSTIATAGGAVVVASYISFGYTVDDAFIVLRYAERWLSTGHLTWEPSFPPSQGFTSPLWLGIGLLSEATGLGIVGVKLVGAVISLLSLLMVLSVLRSLDLGRLASLAATVALALAAPFAIPGVAGLETPLDVAMCVLALLVLVGERPPRLTTGLLLGASAWVRPELAVVTGAGLLARSALDRRLYLSATVGFAVLPLAWMLIAYRVFGTIVPNPALIKIGGQAMLVGRHSVSQAASDWIFPFAIAGAALAQLPRERPKFSPALLVVSTVMLAVHLAFFLNVFHAMNFAARFHARTLPLALFAGCCAGAALRRQLPAANTWRVVASTALLGVAIWLGVHTLDEVSQTRRLGIALQSGHVKIGKQLATCAADNPDAQKVVSLTDDSGAVPYFWQRRAIDLGGLATREVADGRLRPAGMGRFGPRLLIRRASPPPPRGLCASLLPVAGEPYMDYSIHVWVDSAWGRTEAGERFRACVQQGLSLPAPDICP